MNRLRLVIFTFLLFLSLLIPIKVHSRDLSLGEIRVLNKAFLYIKNKKYNDAINLIEKFTNTHKDIHPQVYIYLSNAYMMKKNYDRAISILESIIKKGIKDKSIYPILASCYYAKNKYIEAARYFKLSYNTSKNNEYLYNEAVCLYLSGDKFKAYTILNRLISTKNKVDWIKTYVNVLLSLKKYKQALNYLIYLSNLPIKDKSQYQELRIQLYLLLKQFKTAESYLTSLIENSPANVRLWKYLLNVYLYENKYKDALTAVIIKGYLEPYSEEEKKLMADLFLQLNIPKEAVKFYEQIQAGRYKDIYLILARCYIRMDNFKKAFYWVEKATKTQKTYNTYYLKGEILYNLKKFNDALKSFLIAAKLAKNPSNSYLMAAYCAYYLKKYDLAKKYLKKISRDKKLKKYANSLLTALSDKANSCYK